MVGGLFFTKSIYVVLKVIDQNKGFGGYTCHTLSSPMPSSIEPSGVPRVILSPTNTDLAAPFIDGVI